MAARVLGRPLTAAETEVVNRTLTDTEKENKARHEQQMDVLSETAKLLEVSRSTLWRKMNRLGIKG